MRPALDSHNSHKSHTEICCSRVFYYDYHNLSKFCLSFLIGHCIGGGVMLAMAHDYQIMRSDRGWFSIPIVRLKHTLPLGLLNLAK